MKSQPVNEKRYALIRLEDVGPGGSYRTLEDLGKLRAIFTYLKEENVPFQVAVIPRWKNIQPDGTWYNKGIDDSQPDDYMVKYIHLLKDAERCGAVLGMHGYTHQYGETRSEDNNQDSGIGFEFNVKNAPETDTPAFAWERFTKSLAAFKRAGLRPGFWESPHYHHLREQEKVFQSLIGVIYQADVEARAQKGVFFDEGENHYGRKTLGSVFIPTPLDYINEENTVEKVIDKLPTLEGLASMFFHPFLEFPYLHEVKDTQGNPEKREGIPVYMYKGEDSPLHRLVSGFRTRGFQWVSLDRVVPFSPAHRIDLPVGTKASALLFGDVRGVGHADVVVCAKNGVLVIPGVYQWPRNRPQEAAQVWLKHSFLPDEKMFLMDINNDKKQDLVTYNRKMGEVRVFYSNGMNFHAPVSFGKLPSGLDFLQPFKQNGRTDLIGVNNGEEVIIAKKEGMRFRTIATHLRIPSASIMFVGDLNGDRFDEVIACSPMEKTIFVYPNDGGQIRLLPSCLWFSRAERERQVMIGDTNGDGKAEMILYHPEEGSWAIHQIDTRFRFSSHPVVFGPWARGRRTAFTADFDGNGKWDLVSYDETNHALDLALSFQLPSES
ncbi:hypothetical protein DNHGIG_36640 [Collibacillus ludicampi]|uniref:DUF2334 domain-containing protein n=1 Tax=Collibacillus ludicampi TaxID=2771369 RepID=A0AAV4LK74_9BACL|nr:DUF2334 domain-containing protein [Collibacillus ludicampi]GIM48115.1 hypothetical protein DNHGIG_36640 [Collibacillus ludicampi]